MCAVPSAWRLVREMASRLEIVEFCERMIPCHMSNIVSINRVCDLVQMGSLIWAAWTLMRKCLEETSKTGRVAE